MPLNALYRRTIQQHPPDRWLIQSVCRLCGHEIIGNISDNLHRDEAEHAAKCNPGRAPMITDDSDFSDKPR